MQDDHAHRRHDMLLYTLQIALTWAAPKFLEYPEPPTSGDGPTTDRPHFYIHVATPPSEVVADLPTNSVVVRFGLRTAGHSVGTTVAIRAGATDNIARLDRRWASVVEEWACKSRTDRAWAIAVEKWGRKPA